jgi:hypothetical protein
MPGEGPAPYPSELVEQFWDVQNDHASHVFSANPDGKTTGIRYNSDVPRLYDDINKYSTPGGLMTIMK